MTGEERTSGSRGAFLLESILLGFVGYGVVVLLFVVLNLVQGRSIFYTAALLGADLFYGLESPEQLTITAGPVLAYNGLHMLGFMVAGAFLRWLGGLAERVPQGWYLLVVLVLIVMPHVFGLPLWFEGPIRAELPFWYVVFATSAAALAMGAVLLALHPRLRESMREYRDE